MSKNPSLYLRSIVFKFFLTFNIHIIDFLLLGFYPLKMTSCTCLHPKSSVQPQVAQARNMSIGEHRHCCVLRLSCVVHGQIYGRFMGFYVNGFLYI